MTVERAYSVARRTDGERLVWLLAAASIGAGCWWMLWTQRTYWNPLFFTGLWTSATVVVRTLSGDAPWPWRRQIALMLLSAPLWWWFEFVNEFVRNWQYHGADLYNDFEYQVFATLAFATVVPALHAAWFAAGRFYRSEPTATDDSDHSRLFYGEIGVGIVAQLSVFLWPVHAYALVWVAPFLLFDGIVGLLGGVSLVREMRAQRWSLPMAVAVAGVGTGFFWEMWNFWAWPKWTYSVPISIDAQLFEMPLPGYLGYVPFAWSVYQVVALAERVVGRVRNS